MSVSGGGRDVIGVVTM